MELDAEEISLLNGAGEGIGIVRFSYHHILLGSDIIRMDEIEHLSLLYSLKNRGGLSYMEGVPAHMGNTHASLYPHDLSFYEAQSLYAGRFLALLHKDLQSQANAEEGFIPLYAFKDRSFQLELSDVSHSGAEGSYPRQYYAIRLCYLLGRGSNEGGEALFLKGFLHAAEVAHFIVDNRYHPVL